METQAHPKHAIDAEDIQSLQTLLLEAIKAKTELDLLKRNVEHGAAAEMRAAALLGFLPRDVDLNITEAAEMIQVLGLAPRVPPGVQF